ncbi:MAG: helix-turn-helix domain-containing protein [Heteroscytonema crispum UTEX LB 1556]
MFIFDNKTNIFVKANGLTFNSNYFCDFSPYFKNREFLDMEAIQLGGDYFQGYISNLITEPVMLQLSQRNCLTKLEGVISPKTWFFAIPVQSNRVFFQNLYQLENNYIGIVPPKAEFSVVQTAFSNRFQLYVDEDYLEQLCQTLDLLAAKKFLNPSESSMVICSPEKIRHLQQSCQKLYQMVFDLDRQQVTFQRKALILNFIKQELKEELVKKFILALAEAKDIKPKKNTIRRTSILKQAEEMMRNSLYFELTISDICQELGVSQRTLEYIFKDFYQISPKNYFKKLRLNALHQCLNRNPEPPLIYEIAEKLGFSHRGQLAHDYFQLFGSLPSKT